MSSDNTEDRIAKPGRKRAEGAGAEGKPRLAGAKKGRRLVVGALRGAQAIGPRIKIPLTAASVPTRFRPVIMPDSDPSDAPDRSSQDMPAVRPVAAAAQLKPRHKAAIASFLLAVVLPLLLISGYLFGFAQDQFASEAAFSVRKEEGATTVDAIGGLTQLTGAASTEAEILYDFIRSQDLVERVDRELNLTAIYGRNHYTDPIFTLPADATIEDKVRYWSRMVKVEYNESTGLIRLQTLAFTPEEAQKAAQSIIGHSSAMINRLSVAAREDATRYAREELAKAVERLKEVREAITEYRSRTQVVDPLADIQGQMGLLNTLEAQLAEALIELDLLKDFATVGDPRTQQIERRIEVINKRLAEERRKFGIGDTGGDGGRNYASIVAEYERLIVDRQVAEEAFRSATMILDAALAEAQRKSRYLAAHVEPTLAQTSTHPRAWLIIPVSAFILFMVWALAMLIYYSIRDRR